MQKRALIRLSLGALIFGAGGSALFMAGCGDDDDLPITAVDSGTTDSPVTPPTDSGGGTDTGTKTDSGPPDAGPPKAKIILVHAAQGLDAIRVCFKLGKAADGSDGVIAPVAALPDQTRAGAPFPGIFPGTGGPFPDLGLDLSPFALTPIAIKASAIATDVRTDGGTQRSCQDILSADGGLAAGDSVTFPTLPVGTFKPNTTLLLAVTGCAAGDPGGSTPFPYTAQQKCGSAYTAANSNFVLHQFTLDKTPAGANQLGGQFINLSAGIELQATPFATACGLNTNCTVNGVYPVIVKNDPADAAAPVAVPLTAAPVKFPAQAPATAKGVDGVIAANASLTINGSNTAVGGDGGVGPAVGTASFPIIQASTIGATTPPDYFKNGRNYTFVLLGDPTAGPASPTNGKGVHFLGFDNDPVLPPR